MTLEKKIDRELMHVIFHKIEPLDTEHRFIALLATPAGIEFKAYLETNKKRPMRHDLEELYKKQRTIQETIINDF